MVVNPKRKHFGIELQEINMSKVVDTVSSVLGLKQPKAPAIDIPEAKPPAVAAPSRRQDTGANVVVGSDAAKDKRVSGSRKRGSGSSTSGGDVLGGLGQSGLNI